MKDATYISCVKCKASVPDREQAILCGWHCRDGVWACDACFNGIPSNPGSLNKEARQR